MNCQKMLEIKELLTEESVDLREVMKKIVCVIDTLLPGDYYFTQEDRDAEKLEWFNSLNDWQKETMDDADKEWIARLVNS